LIKIETSPITSEEYYELLSIPGTEVTNFIFPKDEVAWLFWKYSDEKIATRKMSMLP
jgi:hypothetical protein